MLIPFFVVVVVVVVIGRKKEKKVSWLTAFWHTCNFLCHFRPQGQQTVVAVKPLNPIVLSYNSVKRAVHVTHTGTTGRVGSLSVALWAWSSRTVTAADNNRDHHYQHSSNGLCKDLEIEVTSSEPAAWVDSLGRNIASAASARSILCLTVASSFPLCQFVNVSTFAI